MFNRLSHSHDFSSAGPPITIPPKDLTPRMAETSKYSLTCQFSANPSDNLKVEWFRDNYTLPLTLNDDMVIEDEKDENGKIVVRWALVN